MLYVRYPYMIINSKIFCLLLNLLDKIGFLYEKIRILVMFL